VAVRQANANARRLLRHAARLYTPLALPDDPTRIGLPLRHEERGEQGLVACRRSEWGNMLICCGEWVWG